MTDYTFTDELTNYDKLELGNLDKSSALINYNGGRYFDGLIVLKGKMSVGFTGFGGRGEIFGGHASYTETYVERLPEYGADPSQNLARQGYKLQIHPTEQVYGGFSSRHPINSRPNDVGAEGLISGDGEWLRVRQRLRQLDANYAYNRITVSLSKYQLARSDESTLVGNTSYYEGNIANEAVAVSIGNGEIYCMYQDTGGSVYYWDQAQHIWQTTRKAAVTGLTTYLTSYLVDIHVKKNAGENPYLYINVRDDDISVNADGNIVIDPDPVDWTTVKFNDEHLFSNIGKHYRYGGSYWWEIHNIFYQSDTNKVPGGIAQDLPQLEGYISTIATQTGTKKPHFFTKGINGVNVPGTFNNWKTISIVASEVGGTGGSLDIYAQTSNDDVDANYSDIGAGFTFPAATSEDISAAAGNDKLWLRLRGEFTTA